MSSEVSFISSKTVFTSEFRMVLYFVAKFMPLQSSLEYQSRIRTFTYYEAFLHGNVTPKTLLLCKNRLQHVALSLC